MFDSFDSRRSLAAEVFETSRPKPNRQAVNAGRIQFARKAEYQVTIPYRARHHGCDLGPYKITYHVVAKGLGEAISIACQEFFSYRKRSFHTALLLPDMNSVEVQDPDGLRIRASAEVPAGRGAQPCGGPSTEVW